MVAQLRRQRIAGIFEWLATRFEPSAEVHRGTPANRRNVGFGLLAAGAIAACGGSTLDLVGDTSQAVLGGDPSGTDQDGVLLLTMEEGDSWSSCTATLVAPSIIATAKHCVVAIQPGDFYCTGDGEPLDDGSGAGTFRQTPPPQTLGIYVGASPARQQPVARGDAIIATESAHVCRDDVAVVVLDRPIDWVPIVPVARDAPLHSGQEVSVVGYGTGDPSEVPARRVRRGVRILDIGALGPEGQSSKPTTPPRTFTVEGGTVCFGDSGGPALNDAGELVGILSRLSGACAAVETRNTYMVAKSFLDLLDSAAASTSSSESAAESDEGAAGARGDVDGDRLSTAGGPPYSETNETDEQLERRSSSRALRCQVSADLSSEKTSRSLAWTALALLALRTRRAFGGGAHRDVRCG